jgi:hypothetical protein
MSPRREVIGGAKLWLGDCREVLPELAAVDRVVTDPPYGVGLKAKITKHNRTTATSAYLDEPADVLPAILYAAEWWHKNARSAVVTPGTRLLFDYPKPETLGCIFSPNGAGMSRWGFGCFQPILYYGKCPYLGASLGSRPDSFFNSHPGMHVTGENAVDHPCPKPITWMMWLVERGSLPGETVLDPFMGSGTTGVACARLGRRFVGIERESEWFDLACRRIEAAHREPRLPLPTPTPPSQARLALEPAA